MVSSTPLGSFSSIPIRPSLVPLEPAAAPYVEVDAQQGQDEQHHLDEPEHAELVERDLKLGTRYWAAEGKLWSEENPDSYAGVHNHSGMMLIFDEASGIPDPIWAVGAGFFTENILDRYWFAFSNPRRNQGYFYEAFHSKRDFWESRNIDSRTVEDTDKNVYEQIIAEYGADSPQAKVEVYGEFPSWMTVNSYYEAFSNFLTDVKNAKSSTEA